jgi:hypothetical protein
MFDHLKRLRTAKGFGVHSPFAYNFITNVLFEKHPYYAYSDIPLYLSEKRIDTLISSVHQLSFRLVNFFRPKNVLIVGEEQDYALPLFIEAALHEVRICYLTDQETKSKMIEIYEGTMEFWHEFRLEPIDAIIVDMHSLPKTCDITTENLLKISNNQTFWIIRHINADKESRRFWKDIQNDPSIALTFDMHQDGIVILNSSYYKLNYLV